MMSRERRYILFIFFLIAAIDHKFVAAAEEITTEEIIARPVVEYASSNLRDPFRTYLIKDAPKPLPQENADLIKPELDLGKLEVQGIIWGVKIPQVIINNKVLTIGDLIEGAEILSIEKKGIVLSFNGAIFDLAAPGQGSVIKKEK
ncbi:MAG: general secretion pathway protein GspB [Candidatus Omnitrophica bacterium]|nr:general secretion pathway protein GspB [Candidatus Omnitrophota bacterium]MBU4303538.1 general secretion pathway protein GspB [Candidatus Omnitrophota bacterium]MBU4468397.1 general secretion pathway protein GspB [Candidatus Omnitrophota bacterium]MCG2708390.1 general secretion pathway protein GspB [Candidatus Omnitrophota bacterium]